jgi:hypothetical protein
MRGETPSRSRSPLLARWRGAVGVVRDRGPESPDPARPYRPAAGDAAALFQSFEAELQHAVAQPMADTVRRLLEAPRADVLREPTPENYAKLLSALDLVEDVLDAVLLTGPASGRNAEKSQEPR